MLRRIDDKVTMKDIHSFFIGIIFWRFVSLLIVFLGVFGILYQGGNGLLTIED